MIKCIVIEDEPAAQSIISGYISKCSEVDCQGYFYDAFAAQLFLDQNVVDLIFLDINLPEMSGVSFLKAQVNPPLVIFTTAYSQYAVEGFELDAVDYLLKPYSFERFLKALNKAKAKLTVAKNTDAPLPERIIIKSDRKRIPVEFAEILFIEACGDYVTICCTDKKITTHGTLKEWEDRIIHRNFLKIHRSVIVNINHIKQLEGNMLTIGKSTFSVSETYKNQLLERF